MTRPPQVGEHARQLGTECIGLAALEFGSCSASAAGGYYKGEGKRPLALAEKKMTGYAEYYQNRKGSGHRFLHDMTRYAQTGANAQRYTNTSKIFARGGGALSVIGAGVAGYDQWQSDAGDYHGGKRVARAVTRGAIVGVTSVAAGWRCVCGAISFGVASAVCGAAAAAGGAYAGQKLADAVLSSEDIWGRPPG